jgi:prepilin peptidase CpaA
MDLSPTTAMNLICLLIFASLMVWAAIGDVRSFTITNKLNFLIAALFIGLALPMGLPWDAIFDHLKIGLIATGIALAMFYLGVFGGGDAKMTGAIALWLGSAPMIPFIFYTALAGGALGVTLLVSRRLAKKFGLPTSPKWARRMLRKRSAVPYGVALGLGALLAAPQASWFPSTMLG